MQGRKDKKDKKEGGNGDTMRFHALTYDDEIEDDEEEEIGDRGEVRGSEERRLERSDSKSIISPSYTTTASWSGVTTAYRLGYSRRALLPCARFARNHLARRFAPRIYRLLT